MKSILVKILAVTVSLLLYATATNADSYNATTGQLTIPSVLVGGTTYTNVVVTLGSVVSIGTGPAVGTVDSYDAATNQLTIPTVSVGNTTYTNVVITVGSVISFGGSSAGTPQLLSGSMQGRPLTLTGTVTTVSTALVNPYAITTDGTNLYYTQRNANTIMKMVIATGVISTVAGSGSAGAADGIGVAATFNQPSGITTDGTNLYVSEIGTTPPGGNTIRKIVIATGEVTTIAGTAGVAGSADGIGTAATFDRPEILVFLNNALYISDVMQSLMRKIDLATGAVTTIAGQAGVFGNADGVGTAATFQYNDGLTTDGTNLYIIDNTPGHLVRKMNIATGEVTTIAGTAGVAGSADGIGTAASFFGPEQVTTDGTYLYLTEFDGHTIRRITIATNEVTTIAGVSGVTGTADGVGTAASFANLGGIVTDGTSLYVIDRGNNSLRKIQ